MRTKASGARVSETLLVGEIRIELQRKSIRNLHMRVCPQTGQVHVSAPSHLSEASIRAFVASKAAWIDAHRARAQGTGNPRRYEEGESYPLWGESMTLSLAFDGGPRRVESREGTLLLHLKEGDGEERREALVKAWFSARVAEEARRILPVWEARLGVKAATISVRSMRTRWGSCTPRRGTIRLATELARRPKSCLEYVLVHELAHLIEPTHGTRFKAVLDAKLPQWRERKQLLQDWRIV